MTTIIKRARSALNILLDRQPPPSAPRRSAPAKQMPALWPTYHDDQPTWHMVDYAAYVEDGYNLNSLIYSAISFKARALSTPPLRAYEGNLDQPTPVSPNHPLSKLVARPNPWQSWREFQMLRAAYLNLAGNVYVYLERPKIGAPPTALYLMPPDRMFIIPKNKRVIGYLYIPDGLTRRDGVPFVFQDVMHTKFPNPNDPLGGMGYGMSPIAPLAMSGDVDNSVTRFLKTFFERGTLFSGLLKFNVPLDETRVAEIKERWREIYGSEEAWGDIGVLDEMAEYQRVQMTFDEMGFEGIDERNETRILGPFGVPPILIGARSGLRYGTYSNYEQARRACWEDTLIPELRLFEAEDQFYLTTDDGAFVKYDTSDVPALRRDVKALTDSAFRLWQMGVPANLALNSVGLEVGKFAGGDQPFAGRRQPGAPGQPASDPPPKDPPPKPTGSGANADDETRGSGGKARKEGSWTQERKERAWKEVDGIATVHEGQFEEAAKTCFDYDKREILALVGEAKQKARLAKATVNWTALEADVKAYFENAGADNWRDTFIPLVEGVVEDTGEFWASELGLSFNLRNLLGEAWFDDYKLTFASPITQTSSDALHDILAQAQAEGWSVEQMQGNMESLFKQWADGDASEDDLAWVKDRTPTYRTEAIARTETVRASNAGAQAQYKDWGITQKEWLASLDDRCRASHKDANGQVQPIDEPFEVGGYQMMHPLDSSLGAPVHEIVNCRCSELPVIED